MLLGLLLAALLISCVPFLFGVFPQGHDLGAELVRIVEFRHALISGQLPPYWAENAYAGYGSPIFLYYAPFFSFVASLLVGVFDSVVDAAATTIVIFTIVSLAGMEKLMREVIGGRSPESFAAARVAAYVYLLSPYLLGDKLMRNANAEFAALCIIPWVLYGLLRIRNHQSRGLIVLAISFAMVILSHNLTALVAAALLLFGSLILYLPSATVREWMSFLYAVVLGLGLSAFFWVPALGLISFVRPEQLTSGKFDFHGQFQPLDSFFSYEHFFSIGYVGLELLVFTVCMAWFIRDQAFPARKMYIFVLLFSAVFLFLQIPASTFLWEHVPFLSLFQFPWRMMGPFALMLAIASGIAFAYVLRKRPGRFGLFAELTVFIICFLNAMPLFRTYIPLTPANEEILTEFITPHGIKTYGVSSTEEDEYLPRTAQPETWRKYPPIHGPVVNAEPATRIATQVDKGTKIVLDVAVEQATRLRIARWAFPEWELRINGAPADVITNELGSIDISVPAGESRVVLGLKPPRLREVCLWISMASFALLILTLIQWPRPLWKWLNPGRETVPH
jgi:hypothetical protein